MKNFKKEVVYTMPYTTETEIRKAGSIRQKLYNKYNSVQVYMNGIHEIRIVATN